MNDIELAELGRKRVALKAAEEAAIKARRECDAAIQEAMGRLEEGTLKHQAGGVKVSVAYSLTRSVIDPDALKMVWPAMPQSVQSCIRWKPEVDTKALKLLAEISPADHAALCTTYLVAKPASPNVKVELLTVEG